MQVPGFIYTALLLAVVAFLQGVANGLSSMEGIWAPVIVAVLAALIKAVESYAAARPAGGDQLTRSLEPQRGFWSRFLLG